MRAFVAITLPEATRAALASACAAFREAAPEWAGEKWVPEENLHVTVDFLGNLQDEAVPAALDAMALACLPLRPFTLSIGDVVARPGGKARMLWAGIADGVDPARRLEAGLSQALASSIGFEPEKRPYTPHITLVRFRLPRRVPEQALAAASGRLDAVAPACGIAASGPSPLFVSVRRVTLMSSRLSRSGPTYEEVASVPLGHD